MRGPDRALAGYWPHLAAEHLDIKSTSLMLSLEEKFECCQISCASSIENGVSSIYAGVYVKSVQLRCLILGVYCPSGKILRACPVVVVRSVVGSGRAVVDAAIGIYLLVAVVR